jgi:hypothetical protein
MARLKISTAFCRIFWVVYPAQVAIATAPMPGSHLAKSCLRARWVMFPASFAMIFCRTRRLARLSRAQRVMETAGRKPKLLARVLGLALPRWVGRQ